MTPTVLPDSRAKVVRNRIFRHGISWVPVFCAHCGKESGSCPEDNMTFMFYLCNSCFETHGHITNTWVMPDDEFNRKVAAEQMESYGRLLEGREIRKVVEDNSTPLARLLTGAGT
jgi:hypothetical protein